MTERADKMSPENVEGVLAVMNTLASIIMSNRITIGDEVVRPEHCIPLHLAINAVNEKWHKV